MRKMYEEYIRKLLSCLDCQVQIDLERPVEAIAQDIEDILRLGVLLGGNEENIFFNKSKWEQELQVSILEVFDDLEIEFQNALENITYEYGGENVPAYEISDITGYDVVQEQDDLATFFIEEDELVGEADEVEQYYKAVVAEKVEVTLKDAFKLAMIADTSVETAEEIMQTGKEILESHIDAVMTGIEDLETEEIDLHNEFVSAESGEQISLYDLGLMEEGVDYYYISDDMIAFLSSDEATQEEEEVDWMEEAGDDSSEEAVQPQEGQEEEEWWQTENEFEGEEVSSTSSSNVSEEDDDSWMYEDSNEGIQEEEIDYDDPDAWMEMEEEEEDNQTLLLDDASDFLGSFNIPDDNFKLADGENTHSEDVQEEDVEGGEPVAMSFAERRKMYMQDLEKKNEELAEKKEEGEKEDSSEGYKDKDVTDSSGSFEDFSQESGFSFDFPTSSDQFSQNSTHGDLTFGVSPTKPTANDKFAQAIFGVSEKVVTISKTLVSGSRAKLSSFVVNDVGED